MVSVDALNTTTALDTHPAESKSEMVGKSSTDMPTNPPFEFNGRPYFCPVKLTVDALAGKWKPLIVWHLLTYESMRYGELKTAMHTVTHKMLTQSLRELEDDGLLIRTIHQVVPPKVEYALSENGQKLRDVFMAMNAFGMGYKIQTAV